MDPPLSELHLFSAVNWMNEVSTFAGESLGKKKSSRLQPDTLTRSCGSASCLTMSLFMPFMLSLCLGGIGFSFHLCAVMDWWAPVISASRLPCRRCSSLYEPDVYVCPLFLLLSLDRDRLRGWELVLLSGILIRGKPDSSSNSIFSLTHPRQ